MCGCFFDFTADDAYIITRYAENLTRGHGLVFNPGERINALTCPLLAFVEAGLYKLTGRTILAYKLLSILLVFAGHAICLRYLRQFQEASWLYCAFVVPSPLVALWTVGGMETPLLLFLLTAASILCLRILEKGICTRSATGLSILLGLCFLARHDSALFCAPLALALIVRYRRRTGWLVVPAGLIAAAWLLFALWYFHDLFPTSYYIKKPVWLWYEVKRNVAYLAQFLLLSGLGWILIWALVRIGTNTAESGRAVVRHVQRAWGLYAGILCVAGYALLVATKHMMFSYRMLVPYLPVFGVALMSLHAVARAGGPALNKRSPVLVASMVGMLAGQIWLAREIDRVSMNPGFVGEYARCGRRSYVRGFARALRDSADAIRKHWENHPQRDSRRPTISTFAAGITPYYLPEGYFYETLVSHRHARPFHRKDVADRADYLMIMAPEHGPLEAQVAPNLLGRLVVVAAYEFEFDGRRNRIYVFHNPHPKTYCLPPEVDGPIDHPYSH